MPPLNLQEITSIELKYLGNTPKYISEKIGVPERTIEGWFYSGVGKLFSHYVKYCEEMNAKRQENFEKKSFSF